MRQVFGGWSCTSTARPVAAPRPTIRAPPLHALRSTPELAYGLGHGREAGLYLPTIVGANGHFDLAELKVRLKWLAWLAVDGQGSFGGRNLELSRLTQRYSQSRCSNEGLAADLDVYSASGPLGQRLIAAPGLQPFGQRAGLGLAARGPRGVWRLQHPGDIERGFAVADDQQAHQETSVLRFAVFRLWPRAWSASGTGGRRML